MAELLSFIQKYETQGIDVFLESASDWPDLDGSRQFLLTIEKEERAKVYDALRHIVHALKTQEITLSKQKEAIQNGLKQDTAQRSACLTYLDHARNLQKQQKQIKREGLS